MSSTDPWPDAFCWTKMQTESGQPLDTIIGRKEVERRAGQGIFCWGIGSSLGNQAASLAKRSAPPRLLFSTMRSRPKAADTTPGQVLLWTAYVDPHGVRRPLPGHVVVVSRGGDEGRPKTAHYALVCRSSEPLEPRRRGELDLSRFRNLGSAKPQVGASQVTAVLERQRPVEQANHYQVDMLAELAAPYFVRLTDPVPLTPAERVSLDAVPGACGADAGEWLAFARGLRATVLARAPGARSAWNSGGGRPE